uniref:Uncharacterized protein n=1 Tax=Anguilla anguilla TaxID=7936 RepID=A0A0E9SVG1_ANGAN
MWRSMSTVHMKYIKVKKKEGQPKCSCQGCKKSIRKS